MQITAYDSAIVREICRQLKDSDRAYSKEQRLAERILALLLRLTATNGIHAEQIARYCAALRQQNRLLRPENVYLAGKRSALLGISAREDFHACLCGAYCSEEAELLDQEIWSGYRELARVAGSAPVDELTDLFRELRYRSGELMLEVFEAGYIAALQQLQVNGPSPQ